MLNSNILKSKVKDIDTENSWFSISYSFFKHSKLANTFSIFSDEVNESIPNKLSGFLAFYKFTKEGEIELYGLLQESTFHHFNQTNDSQQEFWHGTSQQEIG